MVINDDETKKIIRDIKICFESIGLSIAAEEEGDQHVTLYSEIEGNAYTIQLQVTFFSIVEIILLSVTFSLTAPQESMEVLYELSNLVNKLMLTDYVTVCPDSGEIMLHSSIPVTDGSLDKEQFEVSVSRILVNGSFSFRLLCSQVFSELSPQEHFNKFMSENKGMYS